MIIRIFLFSILFLAAITCLYIRFERLSRRASASLAAKRPRFLYYESVILFLALYLHLIISIQSPVGDPLYFSKTLRDMANGSYHFSGLYSNGGIYYPPLFHYLAWIWAHFLNFLNIPLGPEYPICIFCIKLPGMLCEFLMAALVYHAVDIKKSTSSPDPYETRQEGMRIVAFALILFNPGCIFITSYITQVDGLYTFFVLLTVYLIHKRRLKTSFFFFAAAIMLKFQAVFIAPVVGYAIINQVFLHDFSWKKFWSHLGAGLTAIACMVLSYLPFIYHTGTNSVANGDILTNFSGAVKSFGWATQNAYNFWALVGYNWKQSHELFGPLSCDIWGALFIVLVVLLCALLFIRTRENTDMYPLLGAVMVSGIFLFSVKMMPRYLFPAIVMLILGFAVRPTRRRLLCTFLFSVYFFLVLTFDYIIYPVSKFSSDLILPYLIAAYGLFCFMVLIHTVWKDKETH